MKFTAAQIAHILEGEIEGNPEVEVFRLSKIEEGTEGSLTFLANLKYKPYLYTTGASVTIVSREFEVEDVINTTLIRVDNPYQSFSQLLEYYNQVKTEKKGIEQPIYLHKNAVLGADVYIGAFCYIGDQVVLGDRVKLYPGVYLGDNVKIGDDAILFAGAKVYSDCVIGKGSIIHSGVVIGADGFGYAPNGGSEYKKIPQTGNVILEENVEVGAGTTIDRATLGSTFIRKGVKLDNQIQIAHNVDIGENTVIAAQTGIAGSTKIGKNCMIGGQVGIVGHISIGNNVKIQAQSGISRNIKDNEVLQGSPAMNYGDYNKNYVHFRNFDKIVHRLEKLEKRTDHEY